MPDVHFVVRPHDDEQNGQPSTAESAEHPAVVRDKRAIDDDNVDTCGSLKIRQYMESPHRDSFVENAIPRRLEERNGSAGESPVYLKFRWCRGTSGSLLKCGKHASCSSLMHVFSDDGTRAVAG